MTIKSSLLAGVAMTPSERAQGRYMRNPEGEHGGAAPAPSPAPAPAPAEAAPAAEPALSTEEALEAEFSSGVSEPATPSADDAAPREADTPAQEEEQQGASVEERIAQITAKQREAERDASEARRVATELQQRLDALAPPPEPKQGRDPDAAPNPADYDFGEADPAYIADTATHAARTEWTRLQTEAQIKGEFASMEAKWQGDIAKPEVAEKYPDFQEKVVKAADEGKWDCSPLMAIGIKQSPVGADVAYHLATNTAEASRIAKLTPIEQALEFGRIEGRYMAGQTTAAPTPPKPTEAPPPPAARARGAGGKFATAADTEDFAAFDKAADAMLSS